MTSELDLTRPLQKAWTAWILIEWPYLQLMPWGEFSNVPWTIIINCPMNSFDYQCMRYIYISVIEQEWHNSLTNIDWISIDVTNKIVLYKSYRIVQFSLSQG